MITSIVLADASIGSHNYHFFSVVKTFKIYSLSNMQVYDMVLLAIITVLYRRSPSCFILYLEVRILWPVSPISPTLQSLAATTLLFLWVCLFLDSTYKWDHMVYVIIYLIYSLSMMPSRSLFGEHFWIYQSIFLIYHIFLNIPVMGPHPPEIFM